MTHTKFLKNVSFLENGKTVTVVISIKFPCAQKNSKSKLLFYLSSIPVVETAIIIGKL